MTDLRKTGQYSRCTGVLVYYDEPLELLAAHVSSLIGCVDHLVAVDGAYALFPQAKASSDPRQMRLITEICSGARIGLTTHTPTQVWAGNEVEKRTCAMKLAEVVTDPDGWYLVLDADYVITHIAPDWFEQLARLSEEGWGAIDIGIRETRLIEGVEIDPEDTYCPIRDVYRAVSGMRVGPAHWVFHAPDPETGEMICFRGSPEFMPVDAYDGMHLLRFDHRQERPEYRNVNKLQYYVKRDQLGIENPVNTQTIGLDGKFHAHHAP